MKNKIIQWIKDDWYWILLTTIMAISIALLFYTKEREKVIEGEIDEIETIDEQNKLKKLYYENEIKNLKKANKELYDSIKSYKDQVSYLIQFKYEKEYDTGVVHTKPNTGKDTTATVQLPEPKLYTYSNALNDTMNYKLTLSSVNEPEWYRLNVKLSDKFTIINKDHGDLNEVTIGGENQGQISDVTVFKKKEKTKVLNRIAIGPNVSYSYDTSNNRFGVTIGIGVTYNLFAK